MREKWNSYRNGNNVLCTSCGTYGGATYTIKYKEGKKNHIYRRFFNANATDYLCIKNDVERLNKKGKYTYWMEYKGGKI